MNTVVSVVSVAERNDANKQARFVVHRIISSCSFPRLCFLVFDSCQCGRKEHWSSLTVVNVAEATPQKDEIEGLSNGTKV